MKFLKYRKCIAWILKAQGKKNSSNDIGCKIASTTEMYCTNFKWKWKLRFCHLHQLLSKLKLHTYDNYSKIEEISRETASLSKMIPLPLLLTVKNRKKNRENAVYHYFKRFQTITLQYIKNYFLILNLCDLTSFFAKFLSPLLAKVFESIFHNFFDLPVLTAGHFDICC